jgi:hypothetical protein
MTPKEERANVTPTDDSILKNTASQLRPKIIFKFPASVQSKETN